MKWVSLAFGLVGALALGVSGYFWADLLGSPNFQFILFMSQVRIGGEASDAAKTHAIGSGLSVLMTLPWFSYAGAALSLAGAGLVVIKGRVAAIPLLLASVLAFLPLAWVVLSIPDLAPYLFGGLVGGPSGAAGFAALLVSGKRRTATSPGAELPAADKEVGWSRKKELRVGGIAVALVALLALLVAGLSGRGNADDDEFYFHPGPVALTSNDLFDLPEAPLQLGQMVAAEWEGAWFAGRVLTAGSDAVGIRFVGWESTWDAQVTRDRLRMLPDDLVPKMPNAAQRAAALLGTTQASPSAFMLSFYQPEAGVADLATLNGLPAKQTLYSPRLDLAEVSLERALAGSPIQAGKPFALAAAGTLRVKVAGPHYFAATSNGTTRLWVDDQLVTADSPVQLDAGAHDLRVDHRHDGGSSLTLRLQMGTKPGALRALDLNRDGVGPFAADEDGSLRIVLDEALLFDFDRDNLKPSAERALSSIFARSLAPVPAAPVSIEGHTDASGGAAHNLDLSRRRAESVRGWLAARGRPATSLSIQPYGETRPRVPNDTDDHRRLNRRVELVIGPSRGGQDSTAAAATVAPAVAPATTAPSAAPAAPTGAATAGTANQPLLDVLHAYYRELNDGNFDANRYFEPSVERYITMMNTSTVAMNNYIRNVFPKQFKEHHFELEEGSLAEESSGQYVYIEHSRYIQAGKQQAVEKRVKVRVRLSPAGKLVSLHQFQRL